MSFDSSAVANENHNKTIPTIQLQRGYDIVKHRNINEILGKIFALHSSNSVFSYLGRTKKADGELAGQA